MSKKNGQTVAHFLLKLTPGVHTVRVLRGKRVSLVPYPHPTEFVDPFADKNIGARAQEILKFVQ
jgi:hypothetical protein